MIVFLFRCFKVGEWEYGSSNWCIISGSMAFITMIDAQSLLFSIMVSAGSVKYF